MVYGEWFNRRQCLDGTSEDEMTPMVYDKIKDKYTKEDLYIGSMSYYLTKD
jgi:hypothetical protein